MYVQCMSGPIGDASCMWRMHRDQIPAAVHFGSRYQLVTMWVGPSVPFLFWEQGYSVKQPLVMEPGGCVLFGHSRWK